MSNVWLRSLTNTVQLRRVVSGGMGSAMMRKRFGDMEARACRATRTRRIIPNHQLLVMALIRASFRLLPDTHWLGRAARARGAKLSSRVLGEKGALLPLGGSKVAASDSSPLSIISTSSHPFTNPSSSHIPATMRIAVRPRNSRSAGP